MSLHLERILVPTDFSDCAKNALEQGLALARQQEAELHYLHVMMSHDEDPYSLVYQVADRHAIHEQQNALCRDTMEEILGSLDTDGVEVEQHRVRAFSIASKILEEAKRLDIDLIVLGGHGRRGLRRWLLGSVAEEVVRLAPCPVLTVREQSDTLRMPPQRLVVPIDFSEHSRLALRTAKQLAAPDSQIDLVHVIENPVLPRAYEPLHEVAERYTFPELSRRVEEAAVDFVADTEGPEVVCRVEVLEGRSAEAITEHAQKVDADLVVIATHGLTGLDHLLLGSVSEEVVRMAECPVLILKKPKAS